MRNAAEIGPILLEGLRAAADGSDRVRDIRGVGLMIGVELRSGTDANAVQQSAFERGLLLLECGEASLRFSPPLIVDRPAVDRAVEIFAEALAVAPPLAPGVRETGG